ncbi:hypothetical protein W97_04220 [Coniosporium apollinis CBS 100218]|uniref:Phosphoglycerate mutase n=1 Tax=Coniosporium apollinis (strain CBS 100218) TaxID=1168221 RepID=R7YSW3_CONA1|nr:uncharacterized protein W97_04220 [Coniosporium apollinis CBS 100218]EON64985.1 hypothetical protein W97_04220 [Coniosporium apollinis CBS 100218]
MPPTLILIRHAEALHNATHKFPSPPISLARLPLTFPHKTTNFPTRRSRSSARSNAPMRRTLQTMLIGLDWLVEKGVNVRLDADWQGG